MHKLTRFGMAFSSALVLALGLAACGGSDNEGKIAEVYVMGDSLSDVGTFGYKFTVQDSGNLAKGFPIWTQLVASDLGLDGSAQCHFYAGTTSGIVRNPTTGCTNLAIGGSRVRVMGADTGTANPLTIGTQMAAKAALGGYSNTDLVLIDGGGNDATDLVGAFLISGSEPLSYRNFLRQQLDESTIDALMAQTNWQAIAASFYMSKLAETFYGQIKTHVLDKGASKVVVLNTPDITLTPRFTMLLSGIRASGPSGPAQADALKAAIPQWIKAFNLGLKSKIGNDNRVVLVDFFGDFSDQIGKPETYGLSNVANAVCPVTGFAQGLPEHKFLDCTSIALDQTAGKTAGWWQTYAFADGFHPTPYGHELMAASASRAIANAGWR